eukprot:1382727-Amphidinium_carterae.1
MVRVSTAFLVEQLRDSLKRCMLLTSTHRDRACNASLSRAWAEAIRRRDGLPLRGQPLREVLLGNRGSSAASVHDDQGGRGSNTWDATEKTKVHPVLLPIAIARSVSRISRILGSPQYSCPISQLGILLKHTGSKESVSPEHWYWGATKWFCSAETTEHVFSRPVCAIPDATKVHCTSMEFTVNLETRWTAFSSFASSVSPSYCKY